MGSSFLISCASPGPGWWSWTSRLFATSAQCLRRISALSDWSGCSFRESWRARSVLQLPKKKHHSWVVHIWTRMHVSRKPSQRSLLEFNSIDVQEWKNRVTLQISMIYGFVSSDLWSWTDASLLCRQREALTASSWLDRTAEKANESEETTHRSNSGS